MRTQLQSSFYIKKLYSNLLATFKTRFYLQKCFLRTILTGQDLVKRGEPCRVYIISMKLFEKKSIGKEILSKFG